MIFVMLSIAAALGWWLDGPVGTAVGVGSRSSPIP